ncbi:DUF998 domain-containing protein [Streptomyces sp. NPDC005408]|uniref:DUF998 domain-containing protein n=1 Tax=Streptomyces sp. NPDC005408 TaxID=3155341 RepID=UPI0033BE52D3
MKSMTLTLRQQVGFIAWAVGAVQFFLVHYVVESAWRRPYSWADNNISDLGNVHCGMQAEPELRYVCSPEHGLMIASFVVTGALLIVGVALTWGVWGSGRSRLWARVLLAGTGLGFVLVGLAPADIKENLHVLGALLIMGTGNLGLLLAGVGPARGMLHSLRWVTRLLGALAIGAALLHLSHQYLGFGMGGMERVAVFPILVWTFMVGAFAMYGAGQATTARARNHGWRRSMSTLLRTL